MLVIALLVVAALPASANDSQQDVCDGLLNALDVFENQTRANQRAIENVRALARDAGCVGGEQVCESLGGQFGTELDLWTCFVLYPDRVEERAGSELLIAACREDLDGRQPVTTVYVEEIRDGTGSVTASFWCVGPAPE